MRDRSRNVEDVLPPGTRIEEFEIERALQSGGFGVTYLARDRSLERRVAIKEYLPREWGGRRADGSVGPRSSSHAKDYQWGLTRFLEEARTLARLDHPRIVRVHRVIEAWGTAYMVMEYVEGRNLEEALKAEGPWPEARVRALLDSLLPGLAQVHAAGLIHRDIKPANVMLRADGTPVLIDFGAARYAAGARSHSLTPVLTPGYAPFEQYYQSDGKQGAWTDVYALGAVAYRALSGRTPTEATERVGAIAQKQADPLVPVSQAAAGGVSESFGAAVTSALAVWTEDRPRDVAAWRVQWDAGAVPAPPPSPSRYLWLAALVLLAGVVVVTGYLDAAARRAEAEAAEAERRRLTELRRPGRVFRDCDTCPEMVVMPAGTFQMGSPESEEGRDDDEGPRHEVTLSSPFAMGRYEVTRGEYAAFASTTGRSSRGCLVLDRSGNWSTDDDDASWRAPGFAQGDGHPVVCVSWEDAQAYVRWLSEETGNGYRLPSEAEWEYAARGGTTTSRYWGNGSSAQCDHANGADALAKRVYLDWAVAFCDDGAVHTASVGSYGANAFGLFDMLGNVYEWTGDCWHDTYAGAPSDGSAWTRGGVCGRLVLRGGSWSEYPWNLRSASRVGLSTGTRDDDIGFRVSRTLD